MINEMEEKYPGTKFRIFNSYLSLKGLIEAGAKGEMAKMPPLKKCGKCGEPTSSEICAACKMQIQLS
jgi:tRNA(Ile)-lysidine synthase TilS/MesJ